MTLYSYKNAVTNTVDFVNEVMNQKLIDGFVLHITMTKDNKVIGFIPSTSPFKVEVLQASPLKDLEDTKVEELETVLKKLNRYSKKLMIYVVPLLTPQLSEETLQEINERNWYYIETIKNILLPYQDLQIELSSSSRNLVTYMQQQINFLSIGRNISLLDLNYQEASFFILPSTMLDETIIRQELERKQRIIIEAITVDDLVLLHRFFEQNGKTVNKDLFLKLDYIVSCPTLFQSIFEPKGLFN